LKKVRMLAFGLEGSFEAEDRGFLEMVPFDRDLGLGVDVGVFFAIVVVNGGL
jgi:hypothetical protein